MTERSTVRLFVLRVLVVALLATLFGRLWFLQVYAADEYVRAAGENRVREAVETAPRGEVVDARGDAAAATPTAECCPSGATKPCSGDVDGAVTR